MKTTFISTLTLWNSPRSALSKMQTDLAKANEEISTGRYADVGLELGHRTGTGITLRQESAELDALVESNATVSSRLGATRISLDHIRGAAEDFLSTVLSSQNQSVGAQIVVDGAKANLGTMISELNRSTGSQFIFAGTNTKQKPVQEYETTPASAAKTAVDAAFMAKFGISQTDPAVSAISPADMKAFLETDFANLFDDPAWTANWSSASSQNIESRISTSEKVVTSTNANDPSVRKLAMAYTMASDLGISGLSEATQRVVTEKIVEVLSSATSGLTQVEATLGSSEKKITDANERMSLQKIILTKNIGDLESVDPAEAKTRVDALTTQIQMSYSLTSQLRQISLINYL